MKLSKCERGHFYDGDKYPECPYCNPELQHDSSIVSARSGREPTPVASPTGPVTGWLVALDGAAAGRDLRLGMGRSFLGTDPAGLPVLLSADAPLSVRQGIVAYDPKENSFTLLPGSSAELLYLNGKAALEAMPLAAGDTLTLGETSLRFVPFCGEFRWPAPDSQ